MQTSAGTAVEGLLSLPVAAYEMILAGWLIGKGFGSSLAAAAPAMTAPHELLSTA